uniref:Peroxisomal membrane protein MPV17 n=1 Tax=Noctiluca scintillans TaxID=2966 RepID=A0A7S0ZYI9_NOCSC|mmetsp:Transcript_23537/g.61933  ORF Transcript_23537/g.61933 Transcript_23537/m.61933 type:complete len:180 (+) Transcript_23537:37-576(+)|eukprot:CAMPEP_0194485122 /NCGR_PEP_ID=MMETSP0253-20130528/6232_1 /TAXON_ID=2966 /ORGANISM="Noctiluca scintillans" /LENGTH=179 /DNA_ID=CAMNT_0039325055 /DNA_START=18 /DNA_END=557 /DNA_ORIENTATION=-
MGLLESYDLALQRRPFQTKAFTSVILDALSQQLSHVFGDAPGGLSPTVKQCVIGLISSLIVDKWFRTVDVAFRAWPNGLRTVLAKTALQMTVLQPTLCTYYVTMKKLLQGELRSVPATLRQSLLKLTVAGWSLWGPTAALQVGFVPAQYRALVNSLVGLFYTVFLITQTPPAKESVCKE